MCNIQRCLTLAGLALALLDLLLNLERLRLEAEINNLVLGALAQGDLLGLIVVSDLRAAVGNASALDLAISEITDILSCQSADRLAREEEGKGQSGEARGSLLEVETVGLHVDLAC